MEKLVQVKLRESGQVMLYKAAGVRVKSGDYVIVEMDRSLDYGHVISDTDAAAQETNSDEAGVKPADDKAQEEPIRKIIRLCAPHDLKQIDDNKIRAKEAYVNCNKKIQEYKLDMKLVGSEYSFDRSKIIFYFTAEGRVDFRDLVKELAKVFKARIELRQIGVRDEARLFGGFGSCGRQLCCNKFLKDFEPVMIKMAKEQGLPLNPPKISGLCGRLMCCLSYEYSTYKELSKGLPKEGECVCTKEGKAKVVSTNVLKRCCLVEYEDGRQISVEYKQESK